MDSPEPFYKDVAAWLVAGFVALFAWLGRWAWGKLDGKADRAELLALVKEIREDRERADESRGELHEKVNGVALAVARLEGRLGGEDR